jgi:Domain of unknown function (DUF1906)
MVCGTFTTTASSKADADEQAQNYRDNDPPPTSVSVTSTGSDTWTVTAIWPPCSPGTTHSADTPAAAAIAPSVVPASLKGFDTDHDCGQLISKIVAAKVDFVARYYSNNTAKNLSVSEAKLLSASGVKLVAVWEAQGDKLASFSHQCGVDDSTRAYRLATTVGQPGGTPIYFAVDFDAAQSAVAGAIHDYFQGVADGFAAISRNNSAYLIGVYGSGLVCSWLKGRNLVTHTWLSQSMGWAGSKNFKDWNILQHLGGDPYGLGLTVDPDDARQDYGGFTVDTLIA